MTTTNTIKARHTDELKRQRSLKTQEDDSGRTRHVWQQDPQGRDWLILAAQEGSHFNFLKNILEEMVGNHNPAYAILLGSRAEKWYVFKTDLMPLIELILLMKERTANKEDGSTIYEVDYEISDTRELHLSAYSEVDFIELPKLSRLVNQG